VDDCSGASSFTNRRDFQSRASVLLEDIHQVLTKHGFQMDEAKMEVAWIFASEKPRAASRESCTVETEVEKDLPRFRHSR